MVCAIKKYTKMEFISQNENFKPIHSKFDKKIIISFHM